MIMDAPTPRPEVPKKRLRILQVFSRYKDYGGEEGSVYRIGDALQQHYDVGFFLYSSEDLYSAKRLHRGKGALKAAYNWEALGILKQHQQLGNYDCWLVHNVFPALSPAVYKLGYKLGIPIVQYLHNYRMGCVNGFFLNHGKPCQLCMHGDFLPAFQTACWHGSRFQSGYMGVILAQARKGGIFGRISQWIAISEAQKIEHVAMGISSDKITVIPHFYNPSEDASPYPDRGDVLFIGRLSSEKGVDTLLNAWERVQHSGRALWIVGDGPEREKLELQSRQLGLRNVRFTGFLEQQEIKKIWALGACSVVPSIWKEPLGMVVLEAWANDRPVVANRIGAIPELVQQGVNGYLVAPGDPVEMADAILELLENPVEAASMGRAGHERLIEYYCEQRWMAQVKNLFEKFITP